MRSAFSRATNRAYRVLVIDDDVDHLHTFALLLKEMGHCVDYAINGYVALDVARRFKPDCVICLGMPGATGFAGAAQLRTQEFKDVKLIGLTGYAKPLDPKVLHDLIGDAVNI